MCIQYGFKTGLSKAKGCRGWYEGVVRGKVDRLDYVFVTKNCCICILYSYIIEGSLEVKLPTIFSVPLIGGLALFLGVWPGSTVLQVDMSCWHCFASWHVLLATWSNQCMCYAWPSCFALAKLLAKCMYLKTWKLKESIAHTAHQRQQRQHEFANKASFGFHLLYCICIYIYILIYICVWLVMHERGTIPLMVTFGFFNWCVRRTKANQWTHQKNTVACQKP